MIVPSMTEQEIREELLKDLADLDKPMERFRKNFRSKVLKSYKFPVKTSYDCKSVKRKNLFVVTFTADKRGQHDNPNISMYCIYERKEGKYAAVYQPMTPISSGDTKSVSLKIIIYQCLKLSKNTSETVGD